MDANPVSTLTEDCGIKVHIGSLIGDELRRQRRPAAWLAQEICCDRTNVYKILRKGSIDTELLCRISAVSLALFPRSLPDRQKTTSARFL